MGHAYYGAYVISVICEGSEFADEFVDGLYHVIVVCCIVSNANANVCGCAKFIFDSSGCVHVREAANGLHTTCHDGRIFVMVD